MWLSFPLTYRVKPDLVRMPITPANHSLVTGNIVFLKQLPFVSLPDTILDLLLMYAKIYHLNALAEREEKFLSFLAITCTRTMCPFLLLVP